MVFTPPTLVERSDVALVNAVRSIATNSFQSSVPAATKANVQQSLADIYNYTPNFNEFIDVLLNKVGLTIGKVQTWNDKLAIFKRGPLERGESIEEIHYGLAKAKDYDPSRNSSEADVWGQEPNDVQAVYHKQNRREKFKVTINDDELRKAFLDGGGLFNFISGLMTQGTNADQLNEYYTIVNLFREYEANGGFFHVHAPDLTDLEASDADAKAMLKLIRAWSGNLEVPSRHFNAAHMPAWATPEELVLITTPEVLANMDVGGLAAAFNIDKATGPARIITVPQQFWGIPGAIAILTTADFFVIADTNFRVTSIFNPEGLYTNTWWHHWEIISASPFAPAILFTTEPSDVIEYYETPVVGVGSISVYDAQGQLVTNGEVQRGYAYTVYAQATTAPADGVNDAVRYELDSNSVGVPLSPRTRVNNTRTLKVSVDEFAASLTLKATATDDGEFFSTVTLAVVGDRVDLFPPVVDVDSDDDGLYEVTPDAPTRTANNVTIPTTNANKVQYKNGGTNVAAGAVIAITTGTTTFTATPKTGYEITTGAPASWPFVVA